MKDKSSPVDEAEKLAFVVAVNEIVARKAGCGYLEMFNRLERVGMVDNFLYGYYDLHTDVSVEYVAEEVFENLPLWEKRLQVSEASN